LLPGGSYVAITHFYDPGEGAELHDLAMELQRRFIDKGLGSGWYRTTERIAEYFGDLEIIEPGLVELDDWWPAGPPTRPRYPEERLAIGGVGVKPRAATT
ncbi:SAM-dependent methyltransferase, partial [Nocardia brevicatena]|uniref:SAM-dependent methyltransferase n=1 Tax=Nocardia brevicatena TaxID=37327 RepID=UPI00059490F0